MIYYTRRWRPIQNGSIFKGVTRKDWDRKFQRPTIDPFGNKVTPRRMYYKYLRNRSPIFKEVKQSSAEAFFKRAEQRFIKKYLKPTPFRIFWTQVISENTQKLFAVMVFFAEPAKKSNHSNNTSHTHGIIKICAFGFAPSIRTWCIT